MKMKGLKNPSLSHWKPKKKKFDECQKRRVVRVDNDLGRYRVEM